MKDNDLCCLVYRNRFSTVFTYPLSSKLVPIY